MELAQIMILVSVVLGLCGISLGVFALFRSCRTEYMRRLKILRDFIKDKEAENEKLKNELLALKGDSKNEANEIAEEKSEMQTLIDTLVNADYQVIKIGKEYQEKEYPDAYGNKHRRVFDLRVVPPSRNVFTDLQGEMAELAKEKRQEKYEEIEKSLRKDEGQNQ